MLKNKFKLEDHLPLIAIIRGVESDAVIRVTEILISEGFTMIEVPLNSPNALESIKKLVEKFGDEYLVGAGTVTTGEQAKQVIATGANLVVTPNFNQEVVHLSAAAGCAVFPGIATPSEAFSALAAGATGIKIFPVSALGLDGFKALKSVLPPKTICMPVGGINPTIESMKPYLDLGALGFGLGSALYSPSMSDDEIRNNAKAFVTAYNESLN
ncbi:2-dehydro-3-deoxy-6-phosphogalactonate aldolase [Psychromonas sp. SA13A]|uniref:2-dehydro-3-deoxy-6-phosphogalactonate aldolase n=1 Tax=Psychromonas sp. SA13A TaxID=2686346 RepID=UPI00140DF05D|nr:2-dehydro-3-deoxy-6-phosphogalactonate aldolase [Psychromonas sp. SA13A]